MRTISCTLLISLLPFLSLAQSKQADTSYHLLWFKGRMIRQNVLLTPKGDTVTFTPSKGTVKIISKGGPGKLMDKMKAELDKTPQRINQMITKLATAMPKAVMPYFAEPVKQAFTNVQNDFGSAASNTFHLPELSPAAVNTKGKGGPSTTMYNEYADELDQPMAEVLAYYEKIRNEEITYVPTPPRNDLSYCSSCDSVGKKGYERDFEVFKNELMGKDEYYFTKVLSIMRHSQLFMNEERMNEVNKTLWPVFNFLIERQVKKVKLLVKKYIDDPNRVHAIMRIGLPIERQRQLMGISEDDFLTTFFDAGMHTIARALEKAKNEFDYPVALNVELILSLERQFQLMGSSDEKSWQLTDMLNFNQFKMNVKASGKVSGKGAYMLAEFKGDNYFSAVPDKNCKLQWILMGPDTHKMKYDLVAAEIKGAGGELTYVGSKNWASDKPKMQLDFCDESIDTIEMYTFHEASHEELWNVPGMGTLRLAKVGVIMQGCFIDEERLKMLRDRFSNPAEVAKLTKGIKEQAGKFMTSNNGGLTGKSPSQMSVQEIQQVSQAMNDANKTLEMIHETAFTYLFKLEPQNKNKLVLKQSINGKELFPKNAATEYAWFHLKLEQDPDSPYQLMKRMHGSY